MDELLIMFKERMKIFYDSDDNNLTNILKNSKVAIKDFCGSDDLSDERIRELVIERSFYVYNDSLHLFYNNYQPDLMRVSLKFYEPDEEG